MLNYLKQLLPHEFRQNLKRSLFAHQDMDSRLSNLRRAGFSATGAIDGGAYRGDWAEKFWKVWPTVSCLLIEPQLSQKENLARVAKSHPGSFILTKALGAQSGEVHFRLSETNSAVTTEDSDGVISVPCSTLDQVLDENNAFAPNLLKLDLQGHELEALSGCVRHLSRFEVIILEVSVLRIGDVPIFSEVQRFMEEKQYRLYDFLPQYYRPLDGALWQADAFYVRSDSALIACRTWA